MDTSYENAVLKAAAFILTNIRTQHKEPIALVINNAAAHFGDDAARDAFWQLKSKGAIRFVDNNCITSSN